MCGGDCNDHDSLINPCAFDTNDPNDPVGTDGIDNDCDGFVDNLITCETGLASGFDHDARRTTLNAADLCDNRALPAARRLASGTAPPSRTAQRITEHMGNSGDFVPRTLPPNPAGAPAATNVYMSFLSNGIAEDDVGRPVVPDVQRDGLRHHLHEPHAPERRAERQPLRHGRLRGGRRSERHAVAVHDYTELRMTIKAPINAGSFSFDFAFFSEEYPVYVCQGFNDTFLAIQTSQQYPDGQQIAYDANGHRINVNNSFFQDCNSCTNCVPGYDFTVDCTREQPRAAGRHELREALGATAPIAVQPTHGSGGTDWLTTTSPIAARRDSSR